MSEEMFQKEDEDDKRPTCYLVWEISYEYTGRDITSLRAVCASPELAAKYVKMLEATQPRLIRAWAEPRQVDHLYGFDDVEKARDAYRQMRVIYEDPNGLQPLPYRDGD